MCPLRVVRGSGAVFGMGALFDKQNQTGNRCDTQLFQVQYNANCLMRVEDLGKRGEIIFAVK